MTLWKVFIHVFINHISNSIKPFNLKQSKATARGARHSQCFDAICMWMETLPPDWRSSERGDATHPLKLDSLWESFSPRLRNEFSNIISKMLMVNGGSITLLASSPLLNSNLGTPATQSGFDYLSEARGRCVADSADRKRRESLARGAKSLCGPSAVWAPNKEVAEITQGYGFHKSLCQKGAHAAFQSKTPEKVKSTSLFNWTVTILIAKINNCDVV